MATEKAADPLLIHQRTVSIFRSPNRFSLAPTIPYKDFVGIRRSISTLTNKQIRQIRFRTRRRESSPADSAFPSSPSSFLPPFSLFYPITVLPCPAAIAHNVSSVNSRMTADSTRPTENEDVLLSPPLLSSRIPLFLALCSDDARQAASIRHEHGWKARLSFTVVGALLGEASSSVW